MKNTPHTELVDVADIAEFEAQWNKLPFRQRARLAVDTLIEHATENKSDLIITSRLANGYSVEIKVVLVTPEGER